VRGFFPKSALASKLRPLGQRVILAVNKIDSEDASRTPWSSIVSGFRRLFEISAEHGLGVADLMDAIAAKLPAVEVERGGDERDPHRHRGPPQRRQVLSLNRIAGEERAVVSPVAGTTRDAVDTLVEVEGETYRFVDTAGIRRRKLPSLADQLSVLYAERAIDRAAYRPLDSRRNRWSHHRGRLDRRQDRRLGSRSLLVFNKWDVVEEREEQAKELEREAREDLPHLDFAPVVFLSASPAAGFKASFPHPRAGGAAQEDFDPELNRFLDGARRGFRRARRTARKRAFLHNPGGSRSAPVPGLREQGAEGSRHQLPPLSIPPSPRGFWVRRNADSSHDPASPDHKVQ
jgi:predicted GTPase